MGEALDEERANMLKFVEDGHYSPTHAEIWAKKFGRATFASGPNPVAPNPMLIDRWTLSMAAAWFIWRSYDAVRHQTAEAREGWKIWESISPSKGPSGRHQVKQSFADSLVRNIKYRLVNIHQPILRRVFFEATWDRALSRLDDLPWHRPTRNAPDPAADFPFSRFMIALQTGKLLVTNTVGKNGEGVLETPEFWVDNFRRYSWPITNRPPFFREEAYSVSRQAVIDAEAEIARNEFEQPVVGLEQALGWIAYQNTDNFRSLGQSDLIGKQYYNQLYDHDYRNLQADEKLFVTIVEGQLKGYREGAELTLRERMEMKSIWDATGVRFFRNDLIEIWPDQSTRTRDQGLRTPRLPAGKSVDTTEEPRGAQAAIADEDFSLSKPSHTAAPSSIEARGRPAGVARKTGPRPAKFEAVKEAMFKAVEKDPTAAERLQKMTEKEFQHEFGDISRHLAQKARAALSQFVGVGDSDKSPTTPDKV